MTLPPHNYIMTSIYSEVLGQLTRRERALLAVDVVEYVRLMESDESGTALHWQALSEEIAKRLLPEGGGSLIKSTGDGMIVEFVDVPHAVRCAHLIQKAAAARNESKEPGRALWLRAAVHCGDVFTSAIDVQGKAVNLVARIMALAAPGEVVMSADAKDRLVPELDSEPEDLGECYLKHMPEPVRAYRLRPNNEVISLPVPTDQSAMSVGIAVLPFVARMADSADAVLGSLLADEVLGGLSRSDQMHVISALSSAALAGRNLGVRQIGHALHAAYIVSGSFFVLGTNVRLRLELSRTQDEAVIWCETLEAQISEVLAGADSIVPRAVAAVSNAIIQQELARSSALPLPNLQSHSLLMAGIGLIHRSSRDDFQRAFGMLEHLAQRHPRLPQAHAWLGKWHAMRLVQGQSDDPSRDASHALDRANRALDANPHSALAMTMKGLIQGFMFKDLAAAERHYLSALAANPNEMLAWMYLATLMAWQGRGQEAWQAAQKGLRLSPLDPLRYYQDTMASFAALAAERYADACEIAKRSLRANRLHTATYRTLLISQWMQGEEVEARRTMSAMLSIEPGFSTTRYLERFPGGQNDTSREYARILRAAGAPV
jgi:adenylate cyclase